MPVATDLELCFHNVMLGIYENAKDEAGYNAIRFLVMNVEKGRLKTTKHLLDTEKPSDGFIELNFSGQLEFALNNLSLKPEYKVLFTI